MIDNLTGALQRRSLPADKITILRNSEPFAFTLSSPTHPGMNFRLWLPELAIFNSDSQRGEPELMDTEWVGQENGNVRVSGIAGDKVHTVRFEFLLSPTDKTTLALTLTVENTGDSAFNDYANLAVCLSPMDSSFGDQTGFRTFAVNKEGQLRPVRELAEYESFNHYPVDDRADVNDPEERCQLANGFVARTNMEGSNTIAFKWDKSARVDVNPGGLDCIHSHPAIGPLNPGESITRHGYIVMGSSSPGEYLLLIRKKFTTGSLFH
ncbi:MAG TPA: hypothetical protein VKA68_13940 [bacterium]|nr:hypothetical protein [bacterium]